MVFIHITGAPLTNCNDVGRGVGDRGSYFIPKKITTSEFVYPRKSLLFLQPNKIQSVFFRDPKKSWRLSETKKITLAKISDPKKSLGRGPPLPPSLKYVNGAPGTMASSPQLIIVRIYNVQTCFAYLSRTKRLLEASNF